MPDRPIRGDVNATLNGLVREGVITGFETNFGAISEALALYVRVIADVVTDHRNPAYDEKRVRSIRNRISKDIEPLAPGVIVSVRSATATAGAATASETPGGVTGEQCRAARRLLGWSLEKHAHQAGVGLQTIGAFERGETMPRNENLAAIVGALEAAGVEFTTDEPGVKLRAERS